MLKLVFEIGFFLDKWGIKVKVRELVVLIKYLGLLFFCFLGFDEFFGWLDMWGVLKKYGFGSYLLDGDRRERVRLWDIRDRRISGCWLEESEEISFLKFIGDSRLE